MPLDAPRLLLSAGIILLSAAALLGFAQARTTLDTEAQARWRVVHAGGTAGGVQLIALAVAWHWLGAAHGLLALGVTCSTWLFFIGPMLRALGAELLGRRVNLFGAVIAVPSYLALPAVLLA